MERVLRSPCCGAVVWFPVPVDGFCSSCVDQTICGLRWKSGASVQEDEWEPVPKRIPAVRSFDGRGPSEDIWNLPDELPLSFLFEDFLTPIVHGTRAFRVPSLKIGFHRGIQYLTVSSFLLSEWNVPKSISTLGELKALLR